MGTFPGFAHVAVTVTDLSASTKWYGQLFDDVTVLDEDTGPFHHVVFALGDGTLFGLHSFPDADLTTEFDARRRGLDHVSFACRDRDELARWQDRLEGLGIEHGGIVDAHYGSGLSFKDPDGIALEFFAPPA